MLDGPARGTLVVFLAICELLVSVGQQQQRVSVPFLLDHNRVFVDLDFVRPDGTIRKARAFVDMGAPNLSFTERLLKDLRLDSKEALTIRLGGTPLVFDQRSMTADYASVASLSAAGIVETNLPATILMNYDVVFDYPARTMTLAPPGTIRHEGVRIPCRVNPKTGLVAVNARIASQVYALTIDNGSAYTWIARSVVGHWIEKHPGWLHGVGAVGDANMNGREAETTAFLARLPLLEIGSLELKDVGVAGYAERLKSDNQDFFDWYSSKAPERVVGFIGGNVLKAFRIEIDYKNRSTYWLEKSDMDHADMDQVPVTLRPEYDGSYTVMGVATRNGKKLIHGVFPGDKLIQIGSLVTKNATFGTVIEALHGCPGTSRTLVLEREGKQFTISARIERL